MKNSFDRIYKINNIGKPEGYVCLGVLENRPLILRLGSAPALNRHPNWLLLNHVNLVNPVDLVLIDSDRDRR